MKFLLTLDNFAHLSNKRSIKRWWDRSCLQANHSVLLDFTLFWTFFMGQRFQLRSITLKDKSCLQAEHSALLDQVKLRQTEVQVLEEQFRWALQTKASPQNICPICLVMVVLLSKSKNERPLNPSNHVINIECWNQPQEVWTTRLVSNDFKVIYIFTKQWFNKS